MAAARWSTTIATASFAAAALAIVWGVSRDLRPGPLYATTTFRDWLPIVRDGAVVLEWSSPAAPSRILLPVVTDGPEPLRVRLVDAASRLELAAWTLDSRGDDDPPALLPVPASGRSPRRLRLELSSNADDDARAPRVAWASNRLGGKASIGDDEQADRGPLVVVEYPWPTSALVWLWALVPIAWLVEARKPRGIALPVALGVAALATSLLLWQRDYVRVFAHWDADDFGTYASWLARWVTTPGDRAAAADWFARYLHAHNPLGPVLVATGIAAGAPTHLAYAGVSTACSFASLLLVRRILASGLGLSPVAVAAGLTLYGTHVIVVRAFARPVTDALGEVLTVGTLALLLDRLRRPVPGQLVGLALLNVLHPLARPQGLAFIPFVTAATLAIDARTPTDRPVPAVLRAVAVLAVLPVAVVLGLFVAFDWWDNARALHDTIGRYAAWSTADNLALTLLLTLQLLPLYWVAAGRALRSPASLLLLAWTAYYVAMLVVVRAPFWARHFLPIVPSAVILTAMGLDAARGRARTFALALAAALSAANVAALVRFILDPTNLSLRLLGLTLG